MFSNHGFTLLESLIAFAVLTIGLLGTISLQGFAKHASFDALQRSSALAVAQDIIERINANPSNQIINIYRTSFSSSTQAKAIQSCINTQCNSQQIAAFDIEQWKKSIKATEFTGSLSDAEVCILPTLINPPATDQINIKVIVSWQGRAQAKSQNNKVSCGINIKNRRMITLNNYLLVRQ